ncbi:tumor necrosis factor receptor superfamily member 14-like isoform X3 [Scleropages formosus]|uniref:tumor necrosis factor receptor superfamily member 14-like isoform X3 n=1 Tax=Scleropages formosus TaxID=113540 RepID=UPI0010FACB6D|nr:tumor necrosis factor receptor superfamily member 14-like isoform X3 [Scleropages formosus]
MSSLQCSQYMCVILVVIQYNPCSTCPWAHYEIDGRCCPMCTPGYYVRNDCTSTDITICRPCTVSTFTDEPNGRRNCSACVVCEQDLGLKTVKECKPFEDTVCGVLEGNYCTDSYEGGCRAAQKHTTCKPGDFIKHPGTEYNDTVCENCLEDSYSNGSSTSCLPHTDCESQGLYTLKPGDSVSDSQCGEISRVPLIAGIIVGIILLLLLVGGVTLYKSGFCHKENSSIPSAPALYSSADLVLGPLSVCPENLGLEAAMDSPVSLDSDPPMDSAASLGTEPLVASPVDLVLEPPLDSPVAMGHALVPPQDGRGSPPG